MSPLQLSVVDEAQGNGEVVRMLVEAGCDIDAKCWDITPLMAAASGGHHWALEVLHAFAALRPRRSCPRRVIAAC